MKNKARARSSRHFMKKTCRYMALLSLIFAWWIGFDQSAPFSKILQAHFPLSQVSPVENINSAFDVKNKEEKIRVYSGKAQGYGGPLQVVFQLDEREKIRELRLLAHVDTPGYVVNVLNQRFLSNIEGKSITDHFVIGHDIDGISGATLTVLGVANAVKVAAHEVARSKGLTVQEVPASWHFKLSDVLIAVLIAVVLFEKNLPPSIRKYHLISVGVLSVFVIGYWANMALSISTISSFLLGYWPDPRQNPSIYLLLCAVLFGLIIRGKNIYCSHFCPFHHIQRWAHKLGKNNWPLPAVIMKNSVSVINFMLWVSLMLVFLSRNPAISSYEPFSMLFSLEGIGVQWYILPLALFGSFFVKDFWCRLLCPLGRGINLAVSERQSIKKHIKRIL